MNRPATLAALVAIAASTGVAHAAASGGMTAADADALKQAWGEGIVEIGAVHTDGGDYRAAAREHIETFYAYGDERLLCQETLAEPDLAVVVNTSRLLEHLSGPGGLPHLRESAIALEPAFPTRDASVVPAGSGGAKRNLFFYSRPLNARNLFWRGAQVIARAVEARILDPDEWEFHFVGRGTPDLTLPRDVHVTITEVMGWTDYQEFVASMDAA